MEEAEEEEEEEEVEVLMETAMMDRWRERENYGDEIIEVWREVGWEMRE